MRKIFGSFLAFAFVAVTLFSCSSDDNDNTSGGGGEEGEASVKEYFNFEASKNTPEIDKKNLAEAGNAFITSLNGLENSKLVAVFNGLDALPTLPDLDWGDDDNQSKAQGKTSLSLRDGKIIYLKNFYGTHTWNPTKKEWDYTDSKDNLTLLFPSKGSKTNDSKIVITAVASGATYDGHELPSSVKALIYQNDKQVGAIDASVSKWSEKNDEILPESLDVKISSDVDFTLTMSAKESDKDELNKASLELVKANTVLIKALADFADDSKYDLGKGYVDIRIMDNYAIGAEGEFLKMNEELKKLEEDFYKTAFTKENWNKYVTSSVKIRNDNAKYVLVSNKEKTKIGEAKYIVELDEDGYADEVLVFVFPDKTEVTAAAYLGTGFDSVLRSWNNFINKF